MTSSKGVLCTPEVEKLISGLVYGLAVSGLWYTWTSKVCRIMAVRSIGLKVPMLLGFIP